jgi:hypothetical protein
MSRIPVPDAVIVRAGSERCEPAQQTACAVVPAEMSRRLGGAADGGLPTEQEEVVSAEVAAVGVKEPVEGALDGVADANAPEFNRLAVWTAAGEHSE